MTTASAPAPATSSTLTLLEGLLSIASDATSSASVIGSVISALINLLPLAVDEVEALVPVIKNILAAIEGNNAANEAALAALGPVAAQLDAAWASATPGGSGA